MSHQQVRLGGLSRGEVEGLVGAEGHAAGIGRLELLLAETGAQLGEAVLAVACFKLLPRLPGWVEEGLRDAVEYGRPAPVACVGGQAGKAEAGIGDTGTIADVAADPQGCRETGSRAVGVITSTPRERPLLSQLQRKSRPCPLPPCRATTSGIADRPSHCSGT